VDPNAPNPQYPQGQPPQYQPPQYQPPQYPYQGDPNAQVPPGWGVPAQAPKTRGGFPGSILGSVVGRIVAFLVVAAILGGGAFLYYKIANPDHLSQVIFTTTSQEANEGCTVTNRVSSVKSGTPIYVMVMWSHRMNADEKVVEEDFKDGVSLGKLADVWDPSDYAGYDCTTFKDDVSSVFAEPGAYEIKLTVGDEVVADGTLTVTP
jgi:hypothetical protein